MTPPMLEPTHPDPSTLVALGITAAILLFGLALTSFWMIDRVFA